jgi:hypothetical protein
VFGLVVPFGIGLLAASLAPRFTGHQPVAEHSVFVLFFGIALAISALPVIARILLDLNLLRSDFGMIILAAATAQARARGVCGEPKSSRRPFITDSKPRPPRLPPKLMAWSPNARQVLP